MCDAQALDRAGVIGLIRSGLERLSQLSLDGLAHTQLATYQRDLRGIADQVELLAARGLAAIERTGGYRADGAADITSWLAQTCKIAPESAHDRVMVARSLDVLAATTNLLEHGELNFEQTAVIARAASKLRSEDVGKAEGMILSKGLAMDAGRLRQHAAASVAEIDANMLSRDAARAREKRAFRLGPDRDGLVRVAGELTSACAAYLRAGLAPYMAPVGAEDSRSAGQRRHDALAEMAKRVVEGGGMSRGRSQVAIVAPIAAMLEHEGPPALLQGLVPISREELAMMCCDADLIAVLKDKNGNIAFAGKRARTFSAAKRRAMLSQQPTCVVPGCNRPALDCEAHHLEEWCLGGQSSLVEYANTCPVHHEMLHLEGWALVQRNDGSFRFLPPGDGDNPRRRLTPAQYARGRDEGIRRRQASAPKPDP